jgi:glycine cleavage system H protein
MAMKPEELKYSADHVWVAVQKDEAMLGITDHAQNELADIVFIELPKPGKKLKPGETWGNVESIKSNSDLLSPLTCEILELNEKLKDQPSTLNQDPFGKGWIVRIKIMDPDELSMLMDFAAYQKYIQA